MTESTSSSSSRRITRLTWEATLRAPLLCRTNANAPTARLPQTLPGSLYPHSIFLLTRALPGASARRVPVPVVPGVFVASLDLVVGGGVFSFGENIPASAVVAAARAAAAAIPLRPDGVLYADLTVSSAAAASRTLSSANRACALASATAGLSPAKRTERTAAGGVLASPSASASSASVSS